MIHGKFFASDDFDLAKHRLRNWIWLDDIPHSNAEEGMVIAFTADGVTWASVTSGDLATVEWDDILSKPNLVNEVYAGQGISVDANTGVVTISNTGIIQAAAGTAIRIDGGTDITITNTGVWSVAAGTGVSLSTSVGDVTITNAGLWSVSAGSGISVSTSIGNTTITNVGVRSVTAGDGIAVSATTGTSVQISDTYHLDEFEPGGFVAESGSEDSTVTLTSNRTFSIAPTGTDYSFYCQGVKYTKTATETVTHADTEGNWFFYFTVGGTLTSTNTIPEEAIFKTGAFIAVAYWDSSAATHIYMGDERHGCRMDGRTHWYLHQSFGTQYISGMALGNITADGNGSSDSHCTLSVAGGDIADEDLFLTAQATAATYADWYTYSKTGTGDWKRESTGSVPFASTVNATPVYNLLSGTTWSSSAVQNQQLYLSHIFRTNSATRPFISIMGENSYGSVSAARAGALTEIGGLYTIGLPFIEFTPLGSIIFQHGTAYTNTYNARIRSTDDGDDYVDWRDVKIFNAGSGPTDHGSLSGLGDKDHPTTALQQTAAVTEQAIVWSGDEWIPEYIVNSVSAGTGISLSTSVGDPVITNAGVWSIIAGTDISVNTSLGDVTISYVGTGSGGVSSIAASTGLSASTSVGAVTLTNTGVVQIVAGTNVTVSTSVGVVTISASVAGGGVSSIVASTPLAASTSVGAVTLTFSGSASDVGLGNVVNALQVRAGTNAFTSYFASGTPTVTHTILMEIPAGQLRYTNLNSLPISSAAQSALDAKRGTSFVKMIYIENPTSTDKYPICAVSATCTIYKVDYLADTGAILFKIYENASGTPDTLGTNIYSGTLAAFSTQASTETFSNASIAAENWLYYDCLSIASGTPTKLWIRVYMTEDT
jgi:hypothetical protein